ncbi:MAG: hypothetical protein SWQ30_09590 [Thermodesulfobacteriota bacterium]|nr:hypothetical protein [Thermodesulfobacteriota bacterium]
MKRKRKDPSFDVMIRFFLQQYGVATKQDIERLMVKIDRLEAALKAHKGSGKGTRRTAAGTGPAKGKKAVRGAARTTATETILTILRRYPKGMDVRGLKVKSGFEDKKIRNIIFRLSKEGFIKRVGRGIYAIQ